MKKISEIDKNIYEDNLNYLNAKKLIKACNYSTAKVVLENCLKNNENKISNLLKKDIFNCLGLCLFYLHKFTESQNYFLKALDICESYDNNYNTDKTHYSKITVRLFFYLSNISLIKNNVSQSRQFYCKLEEKINNDNNIDNKFYFLREIIKIFFNLGILKLKQKKSALQEFDLIKKEMGLTSILIIQSKLAKFFRNLLKEDSTIVAWLNYVNEKWILYEFTNNEKLVKIVEHINEQFLAAKPLDKIKSIFKNELNKSSIKIEKIDNLLNDVRERSEIIKVFLKKFDSFVNLTSNVQINKTNKIVLPKIARLPELPYKLNYISHKNELEKDPNRLSVDLKMIDFHSNKEMKLNILQPVTKIVLGHSSSRSMNSLDQIDSKIEKIKSSSNQDNSIKNSFKISKTKLFINETINKRVSENNSNNTSAMSSFKDKNVDNKKKKSNTTEIYAKSMSIDKKIKSISVTNKKAGSIKQSLLHEKLEYKPIFGEIMQYYSSNHYDSNLYDINLPNCIIRYTYKSKTGKNLQTEDKINQDAYITIENFMHIKNFYLFGVCDGHGLNGHNVSNHVKQYLPANFELIEINNILLSKNFIETDPKKKNNNADEMKFPINKLNYKNFLEKNINKLSFSEILDDSIFANNIADCFQKTNEDILERDFNISFSGSTVCNVFLLGNDLFCANVGDSRCVIGRFDKEKRVIVPLQISRDHKPDDADEKARILKNCGRVDRFKTEDNQSYGPARVWLQDEDIPGLAMSRSIGDTVAAKVGVTYMPEIHKFIIIASDGLWEFITNQHAVEIVSKYCINGDCESAADDLVKIATKLWEENESVRDDITVIVVFIDTTNQK